MKNLEVKARVVSIEAAMETAARLAGSLSLDIQQTDTYFIVHEGRLKLREEDDKAELIFYNRPNSREPKYSDYLISEVGNPTVVKKVLESNLGVKTVVTKHRKVFLLENTRIHIDEVDDLGNFVEFEVVLGENTRLDDSRRTVDWLINEFGIKVADLVEGSYCDLLKDLNLQQSNG